MSFTMTTPEPAHLKSSSIFDDKNKYDDNNDDVPLLPLYHSHQSDLSSANGHAKPSKCLKKPHKPAKYSLAMTIVLWAEFSCVAVILSLLVAIGVVVHAGGPNTDATVAVLKGFLALAITAAVFVALAYLGFEEQAARV